MDGQGSRHDAHSHAAPKQPLLAHHRLASSTLCDAGDAGTILCDAACPSQHSTAHRCRIDAWTGNTNARTRVSPIKASPSHTPSHHTYTHPHTHQVPEVEHWYSTLFKGSRPYHILRGGCTEDTRTALLTRLCETLLGTFYCLVGLIGVSAYNCGSVMDSVVVCCAFVRVLAQPLFVVLFK